MKLISRNTALVVGITLSTLFVSCDEQGTSQDTSVATTSGANPNVVLTATEVDDIRAKLGTVPLFDNSLAVAKQEVDAAMEKGIQVPIPKDMAGGYTHTQHKLNYTILHKAGVIFQLTGEEKYAQYTRDVLMKYAEMYPSLPRHPQERSYSRGKIFWQCLNDANWLVHMSQAYDAIRSWIPEEDRETLDTKLFRPFADFLSVETPQFFNRIHNHSTWGTVAVGMIGLVMDDDELVDRALYGIKNDSISSTAMDNDGGLIKGEGQKTGFLANLDEPFSPDGYYTEGPYYQRYAMYPFLAFAKALETKKPALKIFEYNGGVLIKAVDALLNLTDQNGEFFPLNDGQKGMSYNTASLVSAVDIAYYYGNQDARLLSVAQQQGQVELDITGLAVAQAIEAGKAIPFTKESVLLHDGPKGNQGGVAILRANYESGTTALVMKNASHGLSHGHFDKLSYSLYEDGEEILQDYGLARFVNVEQKNGGGYLKENTTWAKQTIAHNTIVIDETSHFKGSFKESSKHHPEIITFDTYDKKLQVVSATENNAYPGTEITRIMMMVAPEGGNKPYIIDINQIKSDQAHQIDLPFYYHGQVIYTGFDVEASRELRPLGTGNGYQHIWKEATGTPKDASSQFTWLNNNKFYSVTTLSDSKDTFILGRVGANDPSFNLRRDPMFIHRKTGVKNAVYAQVIESHGTYNAVTEKAQDAYASVASITQEKAPEGYVAIKITMQSGEEQLVVVVDNAFAKAQHSITISNQTYTWKGNYTLKQIKN
ncbi:alginate lyase family protein [uncultured Dokdonia sp.]|uniref:alginate lyase family protein n=1 Tax=uncultured Dokdonia sp. TaxID=575653 RepID=UPI0030EE38FE|tara:strand:+ start:58250 stop:60547 length:2298 start_codon:yes stop_codon:yes gene_type:complete